MEKKTKVFTVERDYYSEAIRELWDWLKEIFHLDYDGYVKDDGVVPNSYINKRLTIVVEVIDEEGITEVIKSKLLESK